MKAHQAVEKWDGVTPPEQYIASLNGTWQYLTVGQRAMIAARMATRTRVDTLVNLRSRHNRVDDAGGGAGGGIPVPTAAEAAALLGIHESSVDDARRVLRTCGADEIAALENGEINLYQLSRARRTKRKATAPLANRQDKARNRGDMSEKGKNPQRIQKMKIRSEIWSNLRSAIESLTSLPAARDVVAIAKANDKGSLIEDRLLRAAVWLEDFINEWAKAESRIAGKVNATKNNTDISAA